jgi:Flp pilus assembly protein TadB
MSEPIPKTALETPWFRDLVNGTGAATGVPEPLRNALTLATVDRANDMAVEAADRRREQEQRLAEQEHEKRENERIERERTAQQERDGQTAARGKRLYALRVPAWILGVIIVTGILIAVLPLPTILWLLLGLIGLCVTPLLFNG